VRENGKPREILVYFKIVSGKELTGKFSVTETTPALDPDNSQTNFGSLAQN
jgi:hypothetical protein